MDRLLLVVVVVVVVVRFDLRHEPFGRHHGLLHVIVAPAHLLEFGLGLGRRGQRLGR